MSDMTELLEMQTSILDEFPNVAVELVKSADGPTLKVVRGRKEVYLAKTPWDSGGLGPLWALFHASPRKYVTADKIFYELQRELNR